MRQLVEHGGGELAFPKSEYAPAGATKTGGVAAVPLPVGGQLGGPEFTIALGQNGEAAATVLMPEAAVNEHHGAVAGEYEVGASRKGASVEAKAKSAAVQVTTDDQLRFGVPAANGSHDSASGGAVKYVGHQISAASFG